MVPLAIKHIWKMSSKRGSKWKSWVIYIAQVFANFAIFAVHKLWVRFWSKTQVAGHARNGELVWQLLVEQRFLSFSISFWDIELGTFMVVPVACFYWMR